MHHPRAAIVTKVTAGNIDVSQHSNNKTNEPVHGRGQTWAGLDPHMSGPRWVTSTGFDMGPSTKFARAVSLAGIAVFSLAALVGCAASHSPSDAGGEPSEPSQVHARDAVIVGLKSADESQFVASVSKANRSEAEVAWSNCRSVVGKPAKVTYDDGVDPSIIGVILHPHDRALNRCWVTLSWVKDQGWDVTAELTRKDG